MSQKEPPVIQQFYPDDHAWCYGCGRRNDSGLHLQSVREGDEIVARFTPRAEHISIPGYVYGGLIAALIDCHAMATASAHAARQAGWEIGDSSAASPASDASDAIHREAPRFVTAALKVDYLLPTPLGPELILRARVSEAGRRKLVVVVSLQAEGRETARGEVVAVPIPEAMLAAARTS